MDGRYRRPEPAAIDITWISCRGVKSSVPFHTPCLYASMSVSSSATRDGRRPHRVKTPTDRAGGENPEWDAPMRLYVPQDGGGGGVFFVRFELKAEVAVLGDVLAASAAVPVADLVKDGRTRRVSYQLVASDRWQPNGVISFSYAFHDQSKNDTDNDDGQCYDAVTARCSASDAVAVPAPTASSGMYPVIDWPLAEQVNVYLQVTKAVTGSAYYPPPPPVAPVEPIAVYPPFPETACSVYPTVHGAPLSYYPPPQPPPPPNGGGCGYPAVPEWDGRCLYS